MLAPPLSQSGFDIDTLIQIMHNGQPGWVTVTFGNGGFEPRIGVSKSKIVPPVC